MFRLSSVILSLCFLVSCATTQVPIAKPIDVRLAPPKYQQMLQKIKSLATPRHGSENSQLYINYDSPAVNAITWDNGDIVLHKGLLIYARADEEIAGVIGHEYCHILHGDLGRGRNVPSITVEREADDCGLRLSMKAGYNCHKAIQLWFRYAKDHPNYVSTTHPTPIERYQALKRICR